MLLGFRKLLKCCHAQKLQALHKRAAVKEKQHSPEREGGFSERIRIGRNTGEAFLLRRSVSLVRQRLRVARTGANRQNAQPRFASKEAAMCPRPAAKNPRRLSRCLPFASSAVSGNLENYPASQSSYPDKCAAQTRIFLQRRTPAAHPGSLCEEWYIKSFLGVHFAANWASAPQGLLNGKWTFSGIGEISPMGLTTFWPVSQKPKICHLRNDA